MKPIYLDYNASAPLLPVVVQAMQPFLHEGFGNPSSTHYFGMESRRAIEKARQQLARLLNCAAEEIIFTSGGTESNNLAIRGLAAFHRGGHIITSAVEHPAVLEVCHHLEQQGYSVTYLPVDETGRIILENLAAAVRPNTFLISIMLANNEVGTIQPLTEVVDFAHRRGILVHTDAAQALGKIKVDIQQLNVDLLSVAGHKMYAPKGVGALYLRRGIKIAPVTFGAGHEHGLRPGTENVLEIVGLGAAADFINNNFSAIFQHLNQLGERFYTLMQAAIPNIELNGSLSNRLPNTYNFYFPGIDANTLLSELPEIAASTGAACHADAVTPSHVLQAMGFATERIIGSIRFSLGFLNTRLEIEQAVQIISQSAQRLMTKPNFIEIPATTAEIRLTQYTHGLGCACKIRPQNLEKILKNLPSQFAEAVQVGYESSDDAAVYQLTPELSLVTTVDFFTPIVDSAYHFGRIAAANALSDIYAMGAKPLLALNIAAFPEKRLPLTVLEEILKGAQSIAKAANVPILGGHTIEDNEPKFGWVVVGTIAPDKIWRNIGAQVGDALILTKPLGLGILTTALKRRLLTTAAEERIIELMATLNATAADILKAYPVHACTDVTGYGLLGHLLEMVRNQDLSAEIQFSQVPILPETSDLIAQNVIPGGTQANYAYANPFIDWDSRLLQSDKLILCDAQTSGGLLAAVPAEVATAAVQALEQAGVTAAIIGRFISPQQAKIRVVQ